MMKEGFDAVKRDRAEIKCERVPDFCHQCKVKGIVRKTMSANIIEAYCQVRGPETSHLAPML